MATDRPEMGSPDYSMKHQILDKMEKEKGLERGELDGQTFMDQPASGQFEQTDKRAAKRLAKQQIKDKNNG